MEDYDFGGATQVTGFPGTLDNDAVTVCIHVSSCTLVCNSNLRPVATGLQLLQASTPALLQRTQGSRPRAGDLRLVAVRDVRRVHRAVQAGAQRRGHGR